MTTEREWEQTTTLFVEPSEPVGVEPNGNGERLWDMPDDAWYAQIETEDDTPVENVFSEKQQRLLTESLHSSWEGPGGGRTFVAVANVGMFYHVSASPLVPDMLVSLDVRLPAELWEKRHRSYFIWEYGKPPDVVIEVVSNRKGGEDTYKVQKHAEIGIATYIIYDPQEFLRQGVVRVYTLQGASYHQTSNLWMDDVGLGVTLWDGVYEGREDTWLRWCDRQGIVIPTGKERAEQAEERAEQAERWAEQAERRFWQERQEKEQALLRAERLAAKLRELGLDDC